ncbi:MAG TPA: gamma-glutamylcyclotransferase, partial [Prochlorococcus sp.]
NKLIELLFVYATLRDSESSHHLLGNASRVADCVLDVGVLATQAGYPTLKAADDAISGELYQTNSEQ